MFRIRFNSPDSYLVGILRAQEELEDGIEYEVLSIGLLFISIEIIWNNTDKIIA